MMNCGERSAAPTVINYEYTLTNSGKSLGSVTNYFATNANHANSFLAGVAFGF